MEEWLVIGSGVAVAALLLWPRSGLLGRGLAARRLARRVRREDAIKHILKCEINGAEATIESLAGHLEIPTRQAVLLLEDLDGRGLLSFEGGRLHLRTAGRDLALHLIRAHRLWESYLSEETGVAEARVASAGRTPGTPAFAPRKPTRWPPGWAIPRWIRTGM